MTFKLIKDRGENARGSNHPAPPIKQNKGKEPILPGDSDAVADDELSFGSSPLPNLPPPKNNVEVESRKRSLRCSSRFVSGMPHPVRREISREWQQSEQAIENMPTRHRVVAPSFLFVYATFKVEPTLYMPASTTVWGPEDMLFFPLGQHIMNYELPRGFFVLSFSTYDGFSYPYDHMLHFNQAMILNAGDDRLQCKVYSTSLKGPPWPGSTNSRGDLSTHSVSCRLHLFPTTCAPFLHMANISSLQTIFNREDESISDFTRRFRGAVQQINSYNMDAILQNFRRSIGSTIPFFYSLSLDLPTKMEELYRRVDKYSTLEDNIRAASQSVMITTQSNKSATKGQPKQKGSQSKNHKLSRDQ